MEKVCENVTLKKINKFATVPMTHAAAKGFAVNVSSITGACRNCLPAFSRMKWKKPLTALCVGL